MGVAATIGATLLGGFISGRAQQQQYNAAAQQAEVNAQIANQNADKLQAQAEEQAVEHQQNPRSEHLSHLHSSTLFRPRLSLCQRSCSMRASPAERERN